MEQNGNGKSWRSLVIDKSRLRELLHGQNRRIGFKPEPTATAAEARARMVALGVVPEDNSASCGIIAAREE